MLVNDSDDQPTFYSHRWQTANTPDIAFCKGDVHRLISREVGSQLGGSDHQPVILTIDNDGITSTPQKARWNYKKPRWGLFQHRTNFLTKDLMVEGRDINRVVQDFNSAVLWATKEAVPRGARKDYNPYWNE